MQAITTLLNIKFEKQVSILVVLVLFSFLGFSQVKLDLGKNLLPTQEIKNEKYSCNITPVLEVNNSNPEDIKLLFNVEWLDKKSNVIQAPKKLHVFMKINSNIDDYCLANSKTISTKTGLFTSKSVNLVNSIVFNPGGTFSISPYSDITLKEGMLPINLHLIKDTKSQISLNVFLYFGEEKGKTIEIDEIPKELGWSFFLAEKKPAVQNASGQNSSEGLSCGELEEKYNTQFLANKPQYHISHFETKLSSIELMDSKQNELQQLNNSFYEYRLQVNSLVSLKSEIKNNPKYNSCNNLAVLIGSINSYISSDAEINNISTNIKIAVAKSGDDGSGGEEAPPNELFDANCEYCENTYYTLFEIKMKPGTLENHEANYLSNLYNKLSEVKTSQDSYYEQIQAAKENKSYIRKYKNFNEFYDGAIAIILELEPQAKNKKSGSNGGGSSEGGGSDVISGAKSVGSKIPLYYIIGPIVILLVAFGIFKYMKFLKKGKNINDKLK